MSGQNINILNIPIWGWFFSSSGKFTTLSNMWWSFAKQGPKYASEKHLFTSVRSISPQVLFKKAVLQICRKSTGKHPCRIVISINLQRNFIAITLSHRFSLLNFLHISRSTFLRNSCGGLLLKWFTKAVFTWEKNVPPTAHSRRCRVDFNIFLSENFRPSLRGYICDVYYFDFWAWKKVDMAAIRKLLSWYLSTSQRYFHYSYNFMV